MKYLSLLFFLLPFTCLAQINLNGKVVDAADGKPIPDASVFINNTTVGTKTGNDGMFRLSNLKPGQYDLIVSVIGYERYKSTIVLEKSTSLPDMRLVQRTTSMNEVTIAGKDPYRARKLRLFKEQFLGWSELAGKCKILNPEILKLTFSQRRQILTGSTNDFLEIENRALGYKIKYLLNSFR